MWAVVGLGNPGRRYEGTRHNAGFLLVKRAAEAWDVRLKKNRFLAKAGEGRLGGERVLLALPQTYMNESGQSVKAIVAGLPLDPERLIVAYDDVDLPLGGLRVRREGSAGTHKGMASIVAALGTTGFPRLRLGIGPAPAEADIADFVLTPFRKAERKALDEALDRAVEALDLIVAGRIDKAMNDYN
ncbi:MAG: aminoacyl-tRNA hydrolase [Acidobacteriota bacterium]|nr:aminoacyl-tRNA hydrolase [Acidobacteriota bacterium]